MTADTRELYRSPNGDCWLVARDPAVERVFVRHQANAASGGQVSDIEITDFLGRGAQNPEHQALLRLIGTLVDSDRPNRTTARRA